MFMSVDLVKCCQEKNQNGSFSLTNLLFAHQRYHSTLIQVFRHLCTVGWIMEVKGQCMSLSLCIHEYDSNIGIQPCFWLFASTKQLEWFIFFNKHVIWTAEVLIDPNAKYQMSMCSRVDHGTKKSMHMPESYSTSMLATVRHDDKLLLQQSNQSGSFSSTNICFGLLKC